ncbi:MAG: hypothetical protein EOM87_04860 [Clostridia bacterium]|nr:hypothetical protein [Clostridia bacterium]
MKTILSKKAIIIFAIVIALAIPAIVLPIVLVNNNPNEFEEVTVTYYSEGVQYYTIRVIKGSVMSNVPNNPQMEGYVFRGWYLDNGEWEQDFDETQKIDADTSVYAYWEEEGTEPILSYLVAVNGGHLDNTLSAFVYYEGTNITITADIPEGQRFLYWTLIGTDTHFTDNPYTFGVNSNMEFTAVFESLLGNYQVTVSGGVLTDGISAVASYESGSSVTITAIIPEGKSFLCWQVGEQEIYLNPYIFILEGDITLRAVLDDRIEESDRGLQYRFDEDSGTYYVSGFVNMGELFLTIPEYYDNGINGRRKVTRINQSVFENTSLNLMIIPNTVEYIGEKAFAGCNQLDAVYLPDTVDYMGNDVFWGSINLTIYTEKTEKGDNWQLNWNGDVGRIIWGAQGTGIKDNFRYVKTTQETATIIKYLGSKADLIIPRTAEDGVIITVIAARAFRNNSNLKSVEIKEGISRIETEAFMGCYYLYEVFITISTPPALGNKVFEEWGLCIYVPNNNLDEYKIAANWNTYSANIYSQDIISGSFAVLGNTLIQYLGKATEVVTPSTVHRISMIAFLGHSAIKKLVLSAEVQEIEALFFSNSVEVTVASESPYFTMQNNILYSKEITKLIWYPNNKTDTEYVLPDTVTEIADFAFIETQIETIYLRNVTNIGQCAFAICPNLTSIYFDTLQPPDIEDDSFENRSVLTLYVPAGSFAAYTAVFEGFNIEKRD